MKTPGRHRAPSRISVKPAAKATAAVALSGGLAVSMSSTANAAPAPSAAPVTGGAHSAVNTAVPTVTSVWHHNLRRGARGATVKRIQRIAGSYPDGIFGPKTLRAVKRYQGRHHLVRDGIVGPKTARAMHLTTARASSKAPSRSKSRTSASSSSSGIIRTAAAYTGIYYRYGGASTSGFDCSGYTQYVFKKHGVNLPRTAAAQQRRAHRVSSPRPGDLVFFGSPAYHVGIYAGGGKMYDSGKPGLTTQKRKIFSGVSGYGRV